MEWIQLLLFAALLAVAAGILVGGRRPLRAGRGAPAAAVACAGLGFAGAWLWQPGGDPVLEASVPASLDDGGFASSDACRSCHPGPYQAWHRSFHRTMTQAATPDAVRASFDGVTLESRGLVTRLERRGDEFWADIPDPLWLQHSSPERPAVAPRIRVRVVMTTGSHRFQNYWVRRPASGDVYLGSVDNGALVQLPWVWLLDEARWVPSQDSFLTPPRAEPDPPLVWNSACFGCHSVATQPGFAGQRFETRSVELGIACEACHGPAEEHVRVNRSPLRRYARHLPGGDDGDPSIVNPARLDKGRSAAVCGQCHSFGAPPDMESWKTSGSAFRAGDELAPSRAVFRYAEEPRDPFLLQYLEGERDALDGRFWRDGTMRVAGREYNGMIESPCFERGEMTCLSCHSMHAYEDPGDQLASDKKGDAPCLECHAGLGERLAEHTHHAPASEGSRCANCHMPHTTYGLFTAMRSHRIDS